MRKILTGLLAASLLLATGCEHRHHRRHGTKKQVKVYHLNDGRYCYHDDNSDIWFWLVMTDSSGSQNYYTSTLSSAASRPSGYSWSPVQVSGGIPLSPNVQEIQEISPMNTMEDTIVVDERGFPEVDADGNLVDPDQLAPDGGWGPDVPDTDGGFDVPDTDGGGGDGGGGDGGGDGGD